MNDQVVGNQQLAGEIDGPRGAAAELDCVLTRGCVGVLNRIAQRTRTGVGRIGDDLRLDIFQRHEGSGVAGRSGLVGERDGRAGIGILHEILRAVGGIESGSEGIRAYYGNRGYVRTGVRPVFDANADEGTVDIRYEITEGAVGYINKVNISLENDIKNKRIDALIDEFESQFSFADSIIYCENKMDFHVKELGLDLNNGTFFNGAHLSGDFPVTFNKNTEEISIPFFDLRSEGASTVEDP